MRVLFYTILFFFSGSLVAQVGNQAPEINTNSNVPSTNLNIINEAEEGKSESPLLAFFRRKKPTQPATCGSLAVDSDSGVNGVPTRSVA